MSFEYSQDLNYDARFGIVVEDPIEQVDFLAPGETLITSEMINDFIPENEECYSIQISPSDILGLRELFSCDYSDGSMNFNCVHTICIKCGNGE